MNTAIIPMYGWSDINWRKLERIVHKLQKRIFQASNCGKAINKKSKYVLDADISKCFDRINQTKLLSKLNTFPTLRRQIRAWLKAGVMDGKKLFPTNEGTPQGGVISPLLANIALHGLEELIRGLAPKFEMRRTDGFRMGLRDKLKSISVIRYAFINSGNGEGIVTVIRVGVGYALNTLKPLAITTGSSQPE